MSVKHKTIVLCVTVASSCLSGSQLLYAGKGSGATGGLSLTEIFDDAVAGSLFMLTADNELEHVLPTYLGRGVCSDQDSAWLIQNQRLLKSQLESIKLRWIDTDVEIHPSTEVQKDCIVASQDQFSISLTTCRPYIQHRKDAFKEVAFAVMAAAPFAKSREESATIAGCFAEIADRDFLYYLTIQKDPVLVLNYMRDRPDPVPSVDRDAADLKDLLTSSREVAARSLENFANAVMPENSGKFQSIIDWLNSTNSDGKHIYTLLADDIRKSNHLIEIIPGAQNTCAHTDFTAAADVHFSVKLCNIFTRRAAIQTMVHESTHHAPFDIKDELLADRIGTLVAAIIEANPPTLYISGAEQKLIDAEEERTFMLLYRVLHPEFAPGK